MTNLFELYRSPEAPISHVNWAWNMYGAGVENIGRLGKPESLPVPSPASDQLLVRVDAVSLCLSDVKLITQGGKHPKLYDRDLAKEPTRLGHEVSLTVMQVGEKLQKQFQPGQRLAIQPDIYQNGKSTAYGYTIPGGLIQFHLIGDEVMQGDAGSYILPIDGEIGYAEAALTEPWACVTAAYTQRRRLTPKPGGAMWILGRPGDLTEYQFSAHLHAPATIIVTDIPAGLLSRIEKEVTTREAILIVRDNLPLMDYPALRREFGGGFDDIVYLDPRSAQCVSAAARLIARRGTFNLVGRTPLDGNPQIDVGRIHYDYTAYLGTCGSDIAAAYGEVRNRCELRSGGVAIFVGAGGPMGQMHLQRALEMPNGPATILATDVNDVRLDALRARFRPLARKCDKRLVISNSANESLYEFVMRETNQCGVDDSVVCVPSSKVMEETAQTLSHDGMLVLFAGVSNGTFASLNLSDVYLHNAQFTGTSGSALADQLSVIRSTLAGELSPNQSVAAIGGIEAALDGIRAMMAGRYPGKIIIFPQIRGLPLTSLPELKTTAPKVAEHLVAGDVWTRDTESALIEKFWKP